MIAAATKTSWEQLQVIEARLQRDLAVGRARAEKFTPGSPKHQMALITIVVAERALLKIKRRSQGDL
jgi:hypothetical protein